MTDKRETAGIHAPPPLVYLAAVLAGWGVQRLVPIPLGSGDAREIEWTIGWALVVIGGAFMLSAVGFFIGAGTSPNPLTPTKALVFRGPYRITRNPMYLGMTIVTAAVALVMNNAWVLLFTALAVWVIRRFVIEKEEAYLRARFGAPYEEYLTRVRRWI